MAFIKIRAIVLIITQDVSWETAANVGAWSVLTFMVASSNAQFTLINIIAAESISKQTVAVTT